MNVFARRRMLFRIAGLCGITLLWRPAFSSQEVTLARAIRSDPALRNTLVELGRACAPFESTISARHLAELEHSFVNAESQGVSIERWIDTLSHHDFQHGNVISTDGWILSRSEVTLFCYARQFAA